VVWVREGVMFWVFYRYRARVGTLAPAGVGLDMMSAKARVRHSRQQGFGLGKGVV
jgi:hypothetical protein